MKRRCQSWRRLLAAAGMLLTLPSGAPAHPLGQQSVDHYCQINLMPGKVAVVYTLDLAEVATFQESRRIDANGDGALDDAEKSAYAKARAGEAAAGLHLEINGKPLALTPANPKIFTQPGEANLPTLRLLAVMVTAPGALATARSGSGPQAGSFRDENEPERVGWRQLSVVGLGTEILDLAINGSPASLGPQRYAVNSKGNDTDVRAIAFHFLPRASAEPTVAAPAAAAAPVRKREADPFAALMTEEHLTPARMLLLFLLAAGLGGMHALSPGHGKTLVAAYLVGSRGTIRHALILGLIVTVTHTSGVFALGLATLFASRSFSLDSVYPWLTVISGLLIIQIGLFRLFGRGGHHHHHHDHEHPHSHGHPHEHDHEHPHDNHHHDQHDGHSHLPPPGEPLTGRSLLALGISGGLAPCPSALVVLLSAIALHQIGFGLALIVSFSVGLAGVLIAIGIAVVQTHHFLNRRALVPDGVFRFAYRLGALAMIAIGLTIATPAFLLLARRFAG